VTTLALPPAPGAAPVTRRVMAQTGLELRLLLRNGEQLLLTIVIPTVVLLLFAKLPIVDVAGDRVDFVVPGVLALAVLSTAFTGQAIATGFERRYGVLRRLGTTPLTRLGLVTAKTGAVIGVEVLQIGLLVAVGFALGWTPRGSALIVIVLLALGTVTFSALGLLLAGTLRAEATLAAANLLYLLLLGVGGVVVPLHDFGSTTRHLLELLPISAMTDGLRVVLRDGGVVPLHDWLLLLGWGAGGMAITARTFRWD
jgi:ABC-2 type transport system permease protein